LEEVCSNWKSKNVGNIGQGVAVLTRKVPNSLGIVVPWLTQELISSRAHIPLEPAAEVFLTTLLKTLETDPILARLYPQRLSMVIHHFRRSGILLEQTDLMIRAIKNTSGILHFFLFFSLKRNFGKEQ
jgi:hypothetical protein